MRRFIIPKIIASFVLLAFARSAEAADAPPPKSYTSEQLVQYALANNAELGGFEAEIQAAKGLRQQAGLWKNPEFSGDYGRREVTNLDTNGRANGFTRSAAISQTFEFPGKATLRKAIADHNVAIAEVMLLQFRVSLQNKVRQLAQHLVTTQNTLASAREIKDRVQLLTEAMKQRSVPGVQGLLDLRLLQSGLQSDVMTVSDLESEKEEILAELKTITGLPSSIELVVSDASLKAKQLPKTEQLILVALNGNPRLMGRKLELERALQNIKSARLEAAPDFKVGPFFSQDRAGDDEVNYGISVSMELPLWNWNEGNVKAASAQQQQANALLLQARREVENAVVKNLRVNASLQRQLNALDPTFLAKIRDAADLADRHYRLGSVSALTYLDIQRQYLAVVQDYNKSVTRLNDNMLDLDLLTGGRIYSTPSTNSSKQESTQ